MNPLTEAREAVSTALEAAGFTVHPMTPEVLAPPCAWVMAQGTWVEPATLAASRVTLMVSVAVTMNGNNASVMADIEDHLWLVLDELRANNVQVRNVSAPEPARDNNLNVAVSNIEVVVHVTDN